MTMFARAAILLMSFSKICVYADVIVRDSRNRTMFSYPSAEALFGPNLPEEGLAGHLLKAAPVNACENVTGVQPNRTILIALIKRERCTFARKVFNVQQAGYGAAIIFNVDSDDLIPMRGDGESGPIFISSVFVGETSGLALEKFASNFTVVLKEIHSDHSFFFVPFAVVLPLCALIVCFFFFVRCARCVSEQMKQKKQRLSKSNLKKLPIKKFKKGDKFEVCAVCLEEYEDGDKLRELPCAHVYHQKCIDPWLTKNKQTCPLCNRKVFPTDDDSDAENGNEENRSNENTPLLTARGNAMSNYGISVASRSNNVQQMDSDSDESVVESPDELRQNHVVSRAEVHAKPRNTPTSVAQELGSLPGASFIMATGGDAGGGEFVRENAGFDPSNDHYGAETNITMDEDVSTVAVATDPILVEVLQEGRHLPNQDANHII